MIEQCESTTFSNSFILIIGHLFTKNAEYKIQSSPSLHTFELLKKKLYVGSMDIFFYFKEPSYGSLPLHKDILSMSIFDFIKVWLLVTFYNTDSSPEINMEWLFATFSCRRNPETVLICKRASWLKTSAEVVSYKHKILIMLLVCEEKPELVWYHDSQIKSHQYVNMDDWERKWVKNPAESNELETFFYQFQVPHSFSRGRIKTSRHSIREQR